MIIKELLDKLQDKAQNIKWSKDAFNCIKCPKDGCPAWWNIEQQLMDTYTKQVVEKKIEGCGFVLMPLFIMDMTASSYMSYDAINQKFNEVNTNLKKGFIGLAELTGITNMKKIGE